MIEGEVGEAGRGPRIPLSRLIAEAGQGEERDAEEGDVRAGRRQGFPKGRNKISAGKWWTLSFTRTIQFDSSK